MKTKSIKVSEKSHKKLRLISAQTDKTIIGIIETLLVDKEVMKKLTINK
jgi:hypothetical protein